MWVDVSLRAMGAVQDVDRSEYQGSGNIKTFLLEAVTIYLYYIHESFYEASSWFLKVF